MQAFEDSVDPTVAMFDEAAERGTRQVDAQLAAGEYHRGAVLLDAVRRVAPPRGQILDYGCGAGRISFLAAKAGYSVIGVEPSSALVQLADKQFGEGLRLRFWQIRAGEIDGLEAERFDTILCSSVIEFVAEPLDLLRKFSQILARDGRLLVSFANRRSGWRRYAQWRFAAREPHFGWQRNVWFEREAWQVFQTAGFSKAGPTEYFESPFDAYSLLRPLSRLSTVGTLGLLTAQQKHV